MSAFFELANAWVARELGTSTGTHSLVFLLAGGAIASLLPCVYPLYPITAAILRERKSPLGRLAHPLVYYAGLSAIYVCFGVAASLAGGAFNGVLHLPAANLAIGIVLLVLALSTAGYLHFPILSGGGDGASTGLVSTFAMGAGAGLLSSACVGPIVVSILVQLAAGTERVSVVTALTAALKMGAFGMGVGLPVLLIGLFGLSLPRGGRWMVVVQGMFGLLIGYFALGYVTKGLSGLGLSEQTAQGVLVGGALLLLATYLREPDERPVAERTQRALLTLAGVVGFFLLGRAILTPREHVQATSQSVAATAEAAVERRGPLTWHLDKAAAYAEAARLGKPVFVDFHADWCTNCKAFQEQTLQNETLRSALQSAVLLKVYEASPLFASYRGDSRFPELRVGLPFFVITDPRGELLYKTSDFMKADEIALFLSDG